MSASLLVSEKIGTGAIGSIIQGVGSTVVGQGVGSVVGTHVGFDLLRRRGGIAQLFIGWH